MTVAPTPLLRRAVLPYVRDYGYAFSMYEYDGDVGVFVLLNVGGKKDLYVFIIDISERMLADKNVAASEGFRVMIPGVAEFPSGFDAAWMVNEFNSSRGLTGAFTVDEDRGLLNFALETVVPKGSAAPEQVDVALDVAVNTAIWLYCVVRDTDLNAEDWDIEDMLSAWPPNQRSARGSTDDNPDDWVSDGDWDIGDILNPRTPRLSLPESPTPLSGFADKPINTNGGSASEIDNRSPTPRQSP